MNDLIHFNGSKNIRFALTMRRSYWFLVNTSLLRVSAEKSKTGISANSKQTFREKTFESC